MEVSREAWLRILMVGIGIVALLVVVAVLVGR